MNLESLKPAWRKFQVLNSLTPTTQRDILTMIEVPDDHPATKINKLMQAALFLVLTFFFQGG